MAVTNFSSSDALTTKLWEARNEQLFRDAAKESYFMPKFGGKDKNSLVYIKDELEKQAGDRITMGIRMRLDSGINSGVGEGQTLEGNEKSLTTYNHNLTLTRRREAVRVTRGLSGQRTQADMELEAREALKDWMSEYIDVAIFDALNTSPTAAFYSNNGVPTKDTAANAKAALTASQDVVVPKLISAIRSWAVTGGNRSQTPLRPIRVDGQNHYVLLVHPDVAYDLKSDTTYAQAKREADDRGSKNAIFTGALGVWDNVIIHEHENVEIGTNAGSGGDVPYALCHFLGAQAVCWAWGKREQMVMQDFDYEEEVGFSLGMNYGVSKPNFNSLDYGSVGVYVSRTQISDAS